MTSRERMFALLKREIPDCMGIYEHFWGETVPAAVYFDYDIRGVNGSWFNTAPNLGPEEVIEETDEWRVRKDGRGATLKYWKEKSGTPQHIGFEINTPEKWNEAKQPLLELDRQRLDIPALRQGLEDARKSDKFSVYGNLFIFELMRATLGDVTMMENMLLEPDWIRDFCETYTQHYIIHYDYMFREAGKPDGFFMYEDVGFSNGLFCSPATLRELVLPFYKRIVGFLHDNGLPVILHTCGDVRKAVDIIIEAGFDCLQPMEAKAGNNVIEFAKTYGNKISYMGNIDVTVLNKNNPEKTRAEVEHKVRTMREMRIPYIFHSDHSIPPDIHFDTYRQAVEIFRENGKY